MTLISAFKNVYDFFMTSEASTLIESIEEAEVEVENLGKQSQIAESKVEELKRTLGSRQSDWESTQTSIERHQHLIREFKSTSSDLSQKIKSYSSSANTTDQKILELIEKISSASNSFDIQEKGNGLVEELEITISLLDTFSAKLNHQTQLKKPYEHQQPHYF